MQRQEQLGVQFGHYRIYAKLAVGGMAELFLARQQGSGKFHRTVVLKCVLPHLSNDPEYIEMFRDEALIMASLNHPNIVQVLDFEETNGVHFIAMEYIRGQHFKNFRKKLFRLLPDDLDHFSFVAGLVSDVAAGLHYAHTATDETGRPLTLVHRDVSPTNLMLTYHGHVKILDFGVAKAVVKDYQTVDGTIKGKYRYMSPEQIRGDEIDHRSDVFALGIILYELTTNNGLFARAKEVEMIDAVRNAKVRRPSLFVQDYPPALEAIVMKALQADPAERFQSCDEMQRALEEFLRADGHVYSLSERARLMEHFFTQELERDRTGFTQAPLAPAELVRFLGDLPFQGGVGSSSGQASSPLFDSASLRSESPELLAQSVGAEFLSAHSHEEEANARLTPSPLKVVKSRELSQVEDSGVVSSPPSLLSLEEIPAVETRMPFGEARRQAGGRWVGLALLLVLFLALGSWWALRSNTHRSSQSPALMELREDVLAEYKQRNYSKARRLLRQFQARPLSSGDKRWSARMSLKLATGPRLDLARRLAAQQKWKESLQILRSMKPAVRSLREVNALSVRIHYLLQKRAQERPVPTASRSVVPRAKAVAQGKQAPPPERSVKRKLPPKRRRLRRRRARKKRRVRVASAVVTRKRPVPSRPRPGVLLVRANPRAVVEVGGQRWGVTPLRKEALKPGSYTLVFRSEGFVALRRAVVVRSGEVARVGVTLKRARPPAPVVVRSAPPRPRPADSGRPSPLLSFRAVTLKKSLRVRMFLSDPRGIGGRHATSRHRAVCRSVEVELRRLLGKAFRVRGVTSAWCRAVLRRSRKSATDFKTFYPRAVAYVAYRNLARGRSVSRVAQILVSYENSGRFQRMRGF